MLIVRSLENRYFAEKNRQLTLFGWVVFNLRAWVSWRRFVLYSMFIVLLNVLSLMGEKILIDMTIKQLFPNSPDFDATVSSLNKATFALFGYRLKNVNESIMGIRSACWHYLFFKTDKTVEFISDVFDVSPAVVSGNLERNRKGGRVVEMACSIDSWIKENGLHEMSKTGGARVEADKLGEDIAHLIDRFVADVGDCDVHINVNTSDMSKGSVVNVKAVLK